MSGKLNKAAFLAAALVVGLIGTAARADSVTGLYNTGVDSSGNLLTEGLVDPHYVLSVAPAGEEASLPASAFATEFNPSFPSPYWTPNTASSQWISPQPTYTVTTPTDLPGDYTYSTTFAYSGNVSNAYIAGVLAVDNSIVSILLNGHSVGSFDETPGLDKLYDFQIGSTYFQDGTNTLDYVVNNAPQPIGNNGNPSGIQVQYTGVPDTVTTPVPLPASAGVGFSMLGGVGFFALLRKKLTSRLQIA